MLDLTGYGGTVHLAFVYVGTYGNVWGIDDLVIKSKEDPIIPVLATSSLIFPATNMGLESVRWLYFMNVGAGVYEGLRYTTQQVKQLIYLIMHIQMLIMVQM